MQLQYVTSLVQRDVLTMLSTSLSGPRLLGIMTLAGRDLDKIIVTVQMEEIPTKQNKKLYS